MKDKDLPQSFPWSGTHPWDVDVLVIGGGPAGLAAITRLRWTKTFNPVPLAVALVNSGPIGGLAKLGNSILTGPALAFPAGELVSRLEKDLAQYPVPIIQQKALAVTRQQNFYLTTLADGTQISSLSVIMACGMLDLGNIQQFWQKGVGATFGNRENILNILKQKLQASSHPVILGGPHLLKLQKTILAFNSNTILLIDSAEYSDRPGVVCGTLQSIAGKENKLTLKISGNPEINSIDTDQLILEFNSIELNRTLLPAGPESDQAGYLRADTSPGLFVAGDCGGPPFSAVVALGEGTKAGFQAYQYVHQVKYQKPAPLFAYYGDPALTDKLKDLSDFPLHDDLVPARLLYAAPDNIEPWFWDIIDGKTRLGEMAVKKGLKQEEVFSLITVLLKARAITFCPGV